jgi:hypothetical protein
MDGYISKMGILSPFPRKREMAGLAFSIHQIHLKNIKVGSMNDPPIAGRTVGGIVNMTWHIANVNIS